MTLGTGFDDVLRGAKNGESGAFEQIYVDLAPVIRGYARSTGSREPDDILSEVFLAILDRIGDFSGTETKFRSWVMTITHRRVVDELRRKQRRPEDPTEPAKMEIIYLSDPESEALTKLRVKGTLAAINDLTPDQRAVLLLRVLADLPAAEVAAILDKPETAVRALQRRALIRIRKTIR